MKPSVCMGRAVLGVLAMGLLACQKAGEVKKEVATDVKAEEVKGTAIDAYMYAYPLVTMEFTRRVMTNVAAPGASTAPMGQWAKLRTYPAVDNHAVTAPNADTYYTIISARRLQGALGREHAGHAWTVLPPTDARWVDYRIRRSGQTHHGHRRAEIRDHGSRLEGYAPRRCH